MTDEGIEKWLKEFFLRDVASWASRLLAVFFMVYMGNRHQFPSRRFMVEDKT